MKKKIDDNLVFLLGVRNDTEGCIIEGLLDSCGVKATLKYDTDIAWAEVIIGKSAMPVSVYVNKEDYDKAKQIPDSKLEDDEDE